MKELKKAAPYLILGVIFGLISMYMYINYHNYFWLIKISALISFIFIIKGMSYDPTSQPLFWVKSDKDEREIPYNTK